MPETNVIKSRLQLKTDTEANWNRLAATNSSSGFIPLLGEIIIYAPDNTHSYSRMKIGNGTTNVVALPFIDAYFSGTPVLASKWDNFDEVIIEGDTGNSKNIDRCRHRTE